MTLAATLARSLQADIHAELLTRGLPQYTGGGRELELDAQNIRQLLRALGERYPSLEPHLKDGVAVAIDGEIFQHA
jgi:hypothetical protein